MNYQWNEIFLQAERFHRATMLLNSKDPNLQIVSFTNGAFAIELYYKALACKILNKEPKNIHNLKKLFNEFPENVRQEIIKSYNSELDKRDQICLQIQISKIQIEYTEFRRDFEWNLDQVERAFLSFRYIYEKKPASLVFYPELRTSVLGQFCEKLV